ncbi:F-box/kelch-repeat protein [Trifolium pratense]|uniref:F-box/kelch-repeat protein n=1 Tax=Trifolium pratense TaxID=57577 RepID=A0A2K3NS63_TRIPR|nr:F-box/kelch-repeat protein [Trifolium pratense]
MMTAVSKGDGENNGVSYQSPTEETLTQISSSSTTPDNSIDAPSLPFDLVTEILCWIPVKFLLQFCCVCKSWNYLISHDSEFQKKHFRLSTTIHDRLHLILTPRPFSASCEFLLSDILISSIFNNNLSTITATPLNYPLTPNRGRSFGGVSYRHGIFCFGIDESSALLFNPSIRKFKLLPPLENPPLNHYLQTNYTLVYHRFTDNYKIVAVSLDINRQININTHTFGTNYWTKIQNIPYCCRLRGVGISVSDTVNWLVYDVSGSSSSLWVILSLDLEEYSYRKFLQPLSNERSDSKMVFQELKGCLCILSNDANHSDVWIMKEHGNEQSWTKLLSVPYMADDS